MSGTLLSNSVYDLSASESFVDVDFAAPDIVPKDASVPNHARAIGSEACGTALRVQGDWQEFRYVHSYLCMRARLGNQLFHSFLTPLPFDCCVHHATLVCPYALCPLFRAPDLPATLCRVTFTTSMKGRK